MLYLTELELLNMNLAELEQKVAEYEKELVKANDSVTEAVLGAFVGEKALLFEGVNTFLIKVPNSNLSRSALEEKLRLLSKAVHIRENFIFSLLRLASVKGYTMEDFCNDVLKDKR